jgi:LysM repeat protein
VDTLKTAVVVVLLLAVLYGVYVFLNQNEPMPADLAWPNPQGESSADVDLHVPQADSLYGDNSNTTAATGVEPSMPEPSWQNTTAADTSIAAQLPGTDVSSEASPGSSPAPSIAPPALLGASGTSQPSATDTGTSALPTPPEYAAETATPGEMNSLTATTSNVGDTLPADDRFGSYGGATGTATELPAKTAEMAPRYADPVAPVVSPQPSSVPNEDIGPIGTSPLQSVIQSVRARMDAGKWHEALLKLSLYYDTENLSDMERQELLDLLDPLAGKVIYSNEHLVKAPYQVQGNETLQDIAQRHKVPWQLLANINGIQNPQAVAPGTQLKIVQGPFDVDISISRNELTLYSERLYAGRFPIAIGSNPAPQPGEYRVADKLPGRTYYAGDGQTVAVGDPANPYGGIWIDLGQNIGIHGSGPRGPSTDGCISLSSADANDLYGILSTGSKVVIRR